MLKTKNLSYLFAPKHEYVHDFYVNFNQFSQITNYHKIEIIYIYDTYV